MPTAEETRAFFDAIAPTYDRAYGMPAPETRRRMAALVARLPARPCDVLDLGVGTGRELPALFDAGHRVVGIDLAPRMIAEHDRRSRRATIVVGDLWGALPFADASFDAVLALFGTLAHPPDDGARARLGREVARVLRREGLFFAEVPSPAWLARLPYERPAGERAVWRTGPREAVHEDRGVGVTIAISVASAEEWALAPLYVTVEDAGDELFVVARAP